MQKIFMREFLLKNIELLLYFYVAGALISGLMLLLKWSGIHIPSWILMPVCSILAVFLWRYITKKEAQEKQIYEVTLIYQDKTFSVKALYDSGNTLMTEKRASSCVSTFYMEGAYWRRSVEGGWICSTLSDS